MKKSILIFAAAAMFCSCNEIRLNDALPVLEVDCNGTTKISLDGTDGSVWNKGDKVCVFPASSENQCWTYRGNDRAPSGEIVYSGPGAAEMAGHKTAVYPYSKELALSGRTVSGLEIPCKQTYSPHSYGYAILCAESEEKQLHFSYANSFVKVAMTGFGSIRAITVRALGGEKLSGKGVLNLDSEMFSIQSGVDSVVFRNNDNKLLASVDGEEFSLYAAVPSGHYSNGFKAEVLDGSGTTHTMYYSGAISLKPGEYVKVQGESIKETYLALDFSNMCQPFKEDLPDSNFKMPDARNDKEFHLLYNGKLYPFFFHAEYDKAGYGFYLSQAKGLVIGRTLSYIRFPQMDGYVLRRIVYRAGSTGGTPFLASTAKGEIPTKSDKVSESGGATEPGEEYELISNTHDKTKDYFLCIGGGNLCILSMRIYYMKIK